MAKYKGIRNCRGILAVCSAAMLLAACVTNAQKNDRLIRFFDEIAFGGAFDDNRFQNKLIAKVVEPLRFEVEGADATIHGPRIETEIKRLTELTGIETQLVATGNEANVTMKFVEKDAFLVDQEYAGCYIRFRGGYNWIKGADIYISTQDSERIGDCIAHELMHLFGFHYHSGIVRSVLSPVHGEEELTPWDELALTTLYDPRIKPGMLRDEAMPIVRSIIEQ